jgi:hypothetical protein
MSYDAEKAAQNIATPNLSRPDFAQWPDADCGKGVACFPNRSCVSLFLTLF